MQNQEQRTSEKRDIIVFSNRVEKAFHWLIPSFTWSYIHTTSAGRLHIVPQEGSGRKASLAEVGHSRVCHARILVHHWLTGKGAVSITERKPTKASFREYFYFFGTHSLQPLILRVVGWAASLRPWTHCSFSENSNFYSRFISLKLCHQKLKTKPAGSFLWKPNMILYFFKALALNDNEKQRNLNEI